MLAKKEVCGFPLPHDFNDGPGVPIDYQPKHTACGLDAYKVTAFDLIRQKSTENTAH